MATGWLEEYSKGKTVLAGTSWLDEFKGRKVEGPETRGTLLNESLKATIGALDVAASTAHGISMFVPHLGAQAMGYAAGALLPGVSGKELSEKYGGAVESVTLKPGMIEEAVLGEPGTGRRAGELLSSGFEFFLPVEQIQKNLSRMKELGVPEGIADQVGFWWTKLIELTALHGYGEVARGVPKELASKLSELKNAVDSGAKNRANAAANAIKDLIDEDLSKPDSGPGPSGPEGGSSELKGLIRSGEEEVVRIEKVSAEQPRVREFEGRRIKKLKEAIRLEDIRQEELDRQVLEEGRVEPGTTFDRVDWERRGKFLEVDEVGRILPHRKPLKVVEGANKEIITEGISSREAVLEKAAEQPRIREQIVSEKAVGVLTVPQVEQLASSVAGELGVRADKIKVYPTFSSLPEELQRVHVGRLGSRAPIALNAFRIGKSDPNNPNINKGDIIVIANKMASDAKARRVIAHELLHGMRDRLKEMGRSSKLLDLYDKYSDTQEMKRLVKNYKRDPNIEFDRAFLAEEFAVRILDKAIESGKLDRVSKIAKIIHGETRTRGQIVSEAEAGILKQTKKPKFDVIERKIRAYHPSNEVIAKELESVDIWKEISNETKLRVIDIIRSKQIKDRTEWKNILKEESIFDPNLEAKVLDSRPFEERLEDGLSVWEKEVDEWSKSKLEVIEGGKLPLEEVSKGELGYLYHSTNTLNIDNIRSAGLKTARGGKTPISFGIDEATAKGFNKGEVMLRVKSSDVPYEEAAYPNTRRSFSDISPEKIEIKTDKGWKPLISEVPKGKEPTSRVQVTPREFSSDSVLTEGKGRDATSYLLDDKGNYEYAFFGKKEMVTEAEARKYLDNKRWSKTREDLRKAGVDLEVIKVGDKYRLAEPMRAQTPEFNAKVAEATKAVEEVVKPEFELTTEQAVEELKSTVGDIAKFQQGKDIDIAPVEAKVREIGSLFRQGEVADYVDKMLGAIRDAKNARKPTEQGMWIGRHPTKRGLDVVFGENGKVFGDMFEAMDFAEKAGLRGVIEKHPVEEGWVIELREPKPIPFDESKYKSPKSVDDVSEVVRTFRDIMDDIWESIHLDERGSFSFKDMAPEKIEAIRRLTEDARRAGVSVKDWMLKLKYPLAQAEKMQRVVDDLGKAIPIEEPYTTTQKLQVGPVANKGPVEWIGKSGVKISVPKIFEGEAKDLMSGPDMRVTKFREFVPMPFAIKKSGSKVFKALGNWAIQAEFTSKLQKQAVNAEIKAQFKEFKARTGQKPVELGKYLIAIQEGGLERLARMGIKPEEIKDFSGDSIIAGWLRPLLENSWDETNATRVKSGKEPLPALPNYYTFMYAESTAGKYGAAPNRFVEPGSTVKKRYKNFTEKPFRYTNPRSKFGIKAALELDPRKVIRRYMEQQIEHKNFTPLVSKISQLMKPLKTGEFRTTPKGKQVEKLFYMPKHKPGLHESMARWGNWLAGYDEAAFAASLEGTKFARALNVTRRNLTMTMLGGNIRTGAIQVAALANTTSMLGPFRTAGGLAELIRPESRRMAGRKSKVLNLRKAELELDEIVSGVTGRATSISRLASTHIQYTDSMTATATWLAAYRSALARKLPEPKAVEFAEDLVSMTQGTSLRSQLAPIQRTAVGKAITLFQTFTISDWNLMYSEIFGVGNKGLSNKTVIRRVYNTILATTLFNMLFEDVLGINSPAPTPIRAAMESIDCGDDPATTALKVLLEVAEKVPLVGGAAKFGSTPLGPVADAVNDMFMAFRDPWNKNQMDNVGPLAEVGLKFAPLPGLGQFVKSGRAYERGESPLGIALGSRTKKTSLGGLR